MKDQEKLSEELAKLNDKLERLLRRYSYSRAFLSGMLSGFGSVIGATLLVAGIVWMLGRLEVVPVIGAWLADIVSVVQYNLNFR